MDTRQMKMVKLLETRERLKKRRKKIVDPLYSHSDGAIRLAKTVGSISPRLMLCTDEQKIMQLTLIRRRKGIKE